MENNITTHEYGYVREGKIYLNAFLDFPERQIGLVKESEEDSIKYFEKRFEIAVKKVETLAQLIEEAQNKGSYLMKLIHMRKYLANFDGLGNYVVLFEKLDELEEKLRGLISQNRERNLQVKTAFLEEAESLLYADDLVKATDQIKDLKERWIKTGAVVEEEQEAIEAKFEELYAAFFERRKTLTKQRSKEARARQKHYKEILQKAEDLKDSDDFGETFQIFRDLQKKWKEGGKIPHRKATAFWEKFKEFNDDFFSRYKSYKTHYRPLHDPETPASVIRDEYQVSLTEEAESLVNLVEVDTDRAKELLMEWKKLSTTFKGLESEYYHRFRRACDKIFEVSYLLRVVSRKYPDINEKPIEDQLRIKVSFMRELIRRDESEIQLTESNLERASRIRTGRYNMQKRNLENTLKTQKRKMWVKKEVLDTLEEELETIMG